VRRALAALTTLLALTGTLAPPRQDEGPAPQPVAELAGVSDLAGRPARLADAPGEAVLLFFHAGSSRYSAQGLDELVERLHAAPRTRARLWVVAATVEEARAAEPRLAPLGARARVLVDRERGTFAAHGVLAAPTVLCISAQRLGVASVQGYGALFAYRAELGAQLAEGVLERAAYDAALAGPAARDPDALETRQRLLVARLVAVGQLAEAEPLLVEAEQRFPHAAWPTALRARCALARQQPDQAGALAAALARAHPDAPETRYLEARLREASGDAAGALAAYRTLLEQCLFE